MLFSDRACTLFVTVSVSVLHSWVPVLQRRQSLSWNFFTKLPAPTGETGGGMANAIVGSGKSCCWPPASAFRSASSREFISRNTAASRLLRSSAIMTDLLNGVPSIVIGIFAYTLVVCRTEALFGAGGRNRSGHHDDSDRPAQHRRISAGVPNSLREGAMALGATKWKTIFTVVIPAAYAALFRNDVEPGARRRGNRAALFTAG